MFSGTTISFNQMQTTYDQLTTTIFHLHIENFRRILRLLAAILFTFFCTEIVLDTYSLFTPELDSENFSMLGMWVFKQLVNMLGIITAIFCIVAVKLKSRGSSLKFSKVITIFSIVYLAFLIAYFAINFEEVQNNLKNSYDMTIVDDIYFMSCLILFIGFFLKFFTGKAKQYHTIVTQAILENTKQSLQDVNGFSPKN